MIVKSVSKPGVFACVETKIDDDRSVLVLVGDDSVRVEWVNGPDRTKVAMSFEAAAALFTGLSKVMG